MKAILNSAVQCSGLAACSCASSRALAHCCRARRCALECQRARGSAPALPAHRRSRGESAPMWCGACPSSTRGEQPPRSTAPARLGVCACQPARSASSAARQGAARAVWSCGGIFARSALRGLHCNVLQNAQPTAQYTCSASETVCEGVPAWTRRGPLGHHAREEIADLETAGTALATRARTLHRLSCLSLLQYNRDLPARHTFDT